MLFFHKRGNDENIETPSYLFRCSPPLALSLAPRLPWDLFCWVQGKTSVLENGQEVKPGKREQKTKKIIALKTSKMIFWKQKQYCQTRIPKLACNSSVLVRYKCDFVITLKVIRQNMSINFVCYNHVFVTNMIVTNMIVINVIVITVFNCISKTALFNLRKFRFVKLLVKNMTDL